MSVGNWISLNKALVPIAAHDEVHVYRITNLGPDAIDVSTMEAGDFHLNAGESRDVEARLINVKAQTSTAHGTYEFLG